MTTDSPGIDATIYVVDDDASVRRALSRLLATFGLRVMTFATAREFLDYEREDLPGCLILDVQMPKQTGIELQEELVAEHADLPIVFLTAHGDIPMTVKAMQSGAVNFLTKPFDEQQLIDTVQRAIERHTRQLEDSATERDFRRRVDSLSPREYEVLTLVIRGILNKQIARRLGIKEHTVKVHRGRVMEKTGCQSLAELVRLCERSGIAVADP